MWICEITTKTSNREIRKARVGSTTLELLKQIVNDLNYSDTIEEHYYQE